MDESLFLSDQVHERTVKLGKVEHKLHFKEVPSKEFRRFSRAADSTDEDVRDSASAKLIAASLCEPDGTPALTFEKALQLKPAALNAILAALLDVNGVGKTDPNE